MATYTSYYNLTKPEGTERVNIAIINQNMDAIDTQMHKNAQSIIANHGGMAIPSNNNTHAAVSSGQYVYVYNHSSLAEGLYIAKSAISTNGALSLSNLTAVSNGGLNHVYSTLNSNLNNVINTGVLTDLNYEPPKPNLIYIRRYNNSSQNAPDNYSGAVFTMKLADDGNNIIQFAISFSLKIYTRRKSSGTWGEWAEK